MPTRSLRPIFGILLSSLSALGALQAQDVNSLVNAGIEAAREQRYQEAENDYKKALQLSPGNPDILLNLGLAYFKSPDLNQAAPVFEEVVKLRPASGQAKVLLGMCYYGTGRFARALPLLEQDPHATSNIELRQILAEAYIWTGQSEKAIKVIAGLLRDNPDSAVAHMFLGQAYDGEQKEKEAVAEFEAAARANPSEPNVHFGLGYLFWKQKEYDKAKPEFEQELANDPANAPALAYLGDIDLKSGHLENARALLEKCVRIQSNVRIGHLDLGIIDQQQASGESAIREFREAIALDPKRTDAHYRLAAALKAAGQTAEAEKELSIVRTLSADRTDDAIYRVSGPKGVR